MRKPAAIPITLEARQAAELQNLEIQETVRRERKKLLEFIRRRIPKSEDAEDILQDVFYELTEMHRLVKPIEQMASWLFTVARNKITDRYRKKKTMLLEDVFVFRHNDGDGDTRLLDDILPAANVRSADYELMREMVMDTLMKALEELPVEQREVFIWHELEDQSFKDIVAKTQIPLNTLLSRKRYAVLHLRSRLEELYKEFINN
jgi:RNA polymerase sigma factor (sigma-70 family)